MMNEDLIRQIAASVARRVETEQRSNVPLPWPDLSHPSGRQSSEIQNRERISESEDASSPAAFFAPWTSESFQPTGSPAVYPPSPRLPAEHPSQERFNIAEVAETQSAVNELVEFFEAQRCTMEKDKPCDHCDTCRTLGF